MKKIVGWIALAAIVGAGALTLRAGSPEIGQAAPDFTLTDTQGQKRSLSDYKDKHVVLEWFNHGCPFVQKHYNSGNMQALQKEMTGKGVVWLSINSSASGKEGHESAEESNRTARSKNAVPTAILLDENGKVGKLYGAKTTPHMFVIAKGKLAYKGAIDDKASADTADVKGAKNYVRAALDESMAGKPVSQPATQPYGCSVKYK